MSDFDVKEKRFEEDIEDYLTHHGGYTKGKSYLIQHSAGSGKELSVSYVLYEEI